METHQPGWTVTKGKRIYRLWAPRPKQDRGHTAGGTPVVSAAREHWTAGWDSDTGMDGDHWRADTLDQALAPLPGDVEQAFRAVAVRPITEILAAKQQGTDCNDDESAAIKAYFDHHDLNEPGSTAAGLAYCFPLEADEWQADVEQGLRALGKGWLR